MPVRIRCPVRRCMDRRIVGFIYFEQIGGQSVVTAVDAKDTLITDLKIPWMTGDMCEFVVAQLYESGGIAICEDESKEIEF
jgi:hypothetical protein